MGRLSVAFFPSRPDGGVVAIAAAIHDVVYVCVCMEDVVRRKVGKFVFAKYVGSSLSLTIVSVPWEKAGEFVVFDKLLGIGNRIAGPFETQHPPRPTDYGQSSSEASKHPLHRQP